MTRARKYMAHRQRHLYVLLQREPWWSEFWSAIGLLLWAKWVFWRPVGLESRSTYHVLAAVGSSADWDGVAFVIGLLQLTVVCLDHRWGRFVAAFATSTLWLMLAYALWLGNRSAPGAAVYLAFGLANIASMLLLSIVKRAS